MGRIFWIGVLMLGSAGCQSEAQQRESILKAQVEGCVRGFEQKAASRPGGPPPGIDGRRICECTIERATESKRLEELRKLDSTTPTQAELQAAGACAIEEARRAGLIDK